MSTPLRGAVLGHPIGHSKSPAIHNAAYKALGIDYVYTAIDTEEGQLAALLHEVRRTGDWYGLSVTMPLKNEAAELADSLTPIAKALGAVNTLVVNSEAGEVSVVGDNTDVAGIVNALKNAGVRHQPKVAILGGGGTAVAAVAAVASMEATETVIYVRDNAKAGTALDVADVLKTKALAREFALAATELGQYDVVISTLPPRAADPLAADFAQLNSNVSGACLLDVAYDPWPSALASAWQDHDGVVVPGIEMLLYQGVEQAKLFAVAGGNASKIAGQEALLVNVMCDALGLARRHPLGARP